MTDNDDLRERVTKQPIMQAFMRAILTAEPHEADRLKTAMNDMEPDPRMGPLMDALDAEWTALSATPIEALQQEIEALVHDMGRQMTIGNKAINEVREKDARVGQLQQRVEKLEVALRRQSDNMAFALNHFNAAPQWYAKFRDELEQDRAVLGDDVG